MPGMIPTQPSDYAIEWLKEHYSYDAQNGTITNNISKKIITTKTKWGHIWFVVCYGNKEHQRAIMAHHAVWFFHYGEWPKLEIDHINGNPSDNRIDNLRQVTHSENLFNRHKKKHNHITNRGVTMHKSGKYQAAIRLPSEKKQKYLGLYATEQEAANAVLNYLGDNK